MGVSDVVYPQGKSPWYPLDRTGELQGWWQRVKLLLIQPVVSNFTD